MSATDETLSAAGAPAAKVWRRVHRPEDYTDDAALFIACELRLPFNLLRPFTPIVKRILSKWEDAAIEFTALHEPPGGPRALRTFFEITDYSNEAVYGLMEKTLGRLGFGSSFRRRCGDVPFAWVLLSGVLAHYAEHAGIDSALAKRLNEFRLPLSDYFTATTWREDGVEIANLRTGRVEAMPVPPGQVKKIVDWSIAFEERFSCGKTSLITPSNGHYGRYLQLEELYARAAAGQSKR